MEMYIANIILSSLFGLGIANVGPVLFDKSEQGITDLTVEQIPANTEAVTFNANEISHVPAGYFVNLPSLYKIMLYLNVITFVDPYSFAGVPNITFLSLGNNNLVMIHKNMLSGLINLQVLRLLNNKISLIESGSFKDCSALTRLELKNNLLQTLHGSIFDPLNHPSYLSLFTIMNNPLSCDECLTWLKQADGNWLHVVDSSTTICAGPDDLSGYSWNNITTQDLNPTGKLPLISYYTFFSGRNSYFIITVLS